MKTKSELDFTGEIFGYTTNGFLVTLYIEDDGVWYPQTTFNSYWLRDLIKVSRKVLVHE